MLQQKLDTLRLTYTEQHPDIVAILPVLERLRHQKQQEREQRQREPVAKKSTPIAKPARDPLYQQLTISMAEYEATIASLKARVSEYERRYSELKAAANAIPRVEAEYTQLTRDYEVTKRNYDQLMTRRESAQLTGDMQTSASASEFRVIDPPQVPIVPEWPNRPLFASVVLLTALAA